HLRFHRRSTHMHSTHRSHDVFASFASHARARPNAPAVSWKGEIATYGELLTKCQRLSAQLRQFEAGPETVVAIRMERSADLVAAMLAVLHAGAAYLPLDLSIPLERAAYMLGSSRATILLTDADRATELSAEGVVVVEAALSLAETS